MAQRKTTEQTEKAKERALALLASGDSSHEAIARDLGIDRVTLWNWRKNPIFAKQLEQLIDAYRQESRRFGLAIKERRVSALQTRHEALERIARERGKDPKYAAVPGGDTGYLVERVIKGYLYHELDKDLLKELRELERQAAVEMGQWTEKSESTGTLSVRVEYASADDPIILDITPADDVSPFPEIPE